MKLSKPNQLISVIPNKEVTLVQRKTYNLLLKNAQDSIEGEVDDDKRYKFEIPLKEITTHAGINVKDYDYLKEEMKKLVSIVIEVTDQREDNKWKIFNLLDYVERDGDKLRYVLTPMIVQALKDYSYFTKLDLLQVAKLDSKYSVILYELTKRYFSSKNRNIKIPKMETEEFREITNTTDKYKNFYDLRRRVIDPSCKEINEKTRFEIDYTTKKKGRSIKYINFIVDQDFQVEESAADYLFSLLPESAQTDINRQELEVLLQKYEFPHIKSDIEHAKEFTPENFMGFLKNSCQVGHYSLMQKKQTELSEEEKERYRKRYERIKSGEDLAPGEVYEQLWAKDKTFEEYLEIVKG